MAAVGAVDSKPDLVSDIRYVVNGVSAIAEGSSADEWSHKDLWERLAPHVRSGHLQAH